LSIAKEISAVNEVKIVATILSCIFGRIKLNTMKKNLLLTLSTIAFGYASFAQIVNIPDANFKAYLLANTWINTNGDTEIQVSEAAAYNSQMNCSELFISDLTGIEAFTSMTSLLCNDNLLTSLDVSNNTSLVWLDCRFNQLTSLQNLPNSLVELYCSDNQITSLDLSSYPNLNLLSCFNNQLTSLNVANGNNTNFNYNFWANNNPSLTCIQVDDAYWSSTKWYWIDAQTEFSNDCNSGFGCTVTIPDAIFKAYLVGNTDINTNGDSEIQCSEATSFNGTISCNGLSISDLKGIEAFTSLTTLSCFGNQLTSLDLSYNYALYDLNCSSNQISTINLCPNSTLGYIRCANNFLSSIDTSPYTNLISLMISGNNINSLDLTTHPSLINLECHWNNLSSLDLSNNSNLVALRCNNNLNIISLDLSNNTNLTTIQCQDNMISELNVANGNNTAILTFNATGNPATCIQVDDAVYSTTNWTNIDATASFSENCASSINENEQLNISLYPNPASSILTIQSDEVINQIQIFNLLGELIQTEKQSTFSIEQLPSGIYVLQIQTENGQSNQRFVKE
jgi:Leucine-rich repeat (LRR) protein